MLQPSNLEKMAMFAIDRITDHHNGGFTARCRIQFEGVGDIEIDITVEAGSFGKVPEMVRSRVYEFALALARATDR